MDLQHCQVFYIYDELSLKPIGIKDRFEVHRDGDWHFAVNAFILRRNNRGILEVLLQERSEYVDIAQGYFDQSLATQLLVSDEEHIERAVYRGLMDELSIKKNDIKLLQKWNTIGQIQISKRYQYNLDLWNREFIVNYFIVLQDSVRLKKNYRVKKIEWLPWEDFTRLVRIQPNRFTKSTRLYCADVRIADQIGLIMNNMCSGLEDNPTQALFKGKILMSSFSEFDVMVIQYTEASLWKMVIYKTKYSIINYSEYYISNINEVSKVMFRMRNKDYTIEMFESEIYASVERGC